MNILRDKLFNTVLRFRGSLFILVFDLINVKLIEDLEWLRFFVKGFNL